MDTTDRLRLLYPDIHGLERGKYLFGDVAANGLAAFCIGVYPLTHDREILMVPKTQFDVGLHDVEARLDRESLRPSWEADTTIGSRTWNSTASRSRSTRGTCSGRRSRHGGAWVSSPK